MTARRSLLSGVLAAAVLVPSVLWLSPALLKSQAPSFRDQGDFFFPLKLYTADRLRQGTIPLWNPLSATGEPWLANVQSGVFYPPGWLFLLPGPGLAAALFLLLHFALAAWGTWAFLKEESVSDSGALFGTAISCASGFAASLSAYWNHFGAWAYLPGIAALARSGLSSRSKQLALAALIGLQAMAGGPEISAATLLLGAVLSLSPRPPVEDGWARPTRRRPLLRFGAATLLGLALAGWALVPFAELILRSDRRTSLAALEREVGAVSLEALSSALGTSDRGSGTFYLSSFYVGPLALFAALSAFSERERRNFAWLLAGIALAGVVFAISAPPGSWLRALPPLDRFRYPAKALVWTLFGLSILAGLGADRLRFRPPDTRPLRLFCAATGAAALATILLSPLPSPVRGTATIGLGALLLLAFGVGRQPLAGATLEGTAALALLLSLGFAGRSLFRFAQACEIRREPSGLESLAHLSGRVLTPPMGRLAWRTIQDERFEAATLRRQRESLLGYTNLLFGIATVRTAAALSTEAAGRIADEIDNSPDPVRAAGAASVRVLWTPFRPVSLPSRKVGEFFRVPVAPYRPRLSFVRGFRVEPDPVRAWSRVARGEIDLTREVFIDREPRPLPPNQLGKPLLLARLAEDQPEHVVAEITSNTGGVLVLTDLYYPGWTAQVDGHPADLLRADGFFRAVALSAGSHQVVFRYRPLSFWIGAALSLFALLTLGALALRATPAESESLL